MPQALTANEGGSIQDQEARDQLSNGLGALTQGASANFNSKLKAGIISNMLSIIRGGSSSKKRKRRSITITIVTPKTPSQVEQDLQPFSNTIDATSPGPDSATDSQSKADFLSALDSLSASLCKSYAIGEPAGIATSDLVVLQAIMKGFSDVHTNEIQLGCSDCSAKLRGPDFVLLGTYLKTKYESFSCHVGETCTGACVTSAQVGWYGDSH